MYKMCNMALKSTPLSLLWLMFCAMINASDPTFHLFCGFKYPPSCFCVCWKIKMQIISMKQVNFVNSSIHHGGLKYPPWWIGLSTILICVYFENKNAYLKQETSEIVVKSIHHGGLLFNCIIINLKSSENKERWRLSTISIGCLFLQINHHLHYSPFHAKGLTIIRCTGQQVQHIKSTLH